jgi:hypothetical protein
MIGTPNDQRRKIREQLRYELALPETPKKKCVKPLLGLSSTRSKFLQNPRKSKQPGEKPL